MQAKMLRRLGFGMLVSLLAVGTMRGQAPAFSAEHGIYGQEFRLWITSPVESANIFYTLDGSDPRREGLPYGGSLGINATTVVRAALLLPDSTWSDVTTASYVIPESLLQQSNRPSGYPAYWGNYCEIEGRAIADYGMDLELTRNATYAKYITEGITTLPIVSLSTAPGNLFSDTPDPETGGIYIFTGCPVGDGTGRGWERPVTFEMMNGPDGLDLTVDCCVKLHGGHGRLPEKNPKHAFRLHFKSAYGPGKLKYPVFGTHGPNRFNALVLRTFFGYSWVHWDNMQRNRAQYTRDLWARATQSQMGDPVSMGQYVHLFLNGLYWGIYNMCERVSDDFCAQHFGGSEEDWDVTEVDGGAGNKYAAFADYGTIDAWNQMVDLIYELPNQKSYMHLIGCGSDGKPNVKYPPLLDADNFIHYMLINLYGGNTDWDQHNWYAFRNRVSADRGFRFICWDSETVIVSPTENLTNKNTRGCPTGFLNRLMRERLFLHRFHEEAQRMLTHGGPLTPEGALATWDSLYHTIELALWDESGRWGDYRRDVHPYKTVGSLYKPNDAYQAERMRLLRQYFPVRTDNFIKQLRDRGWFPSTPAPAVCIDGCEVGYDVQPFPTGSILTMTGTNIFYTLDGTAPVNWFSADEGTLSPTAKPYIEGENVLDGMASNALPDTIMLRAICNSGGEWSPIVTVRLVAEDPDGLSLVLSDGEASPTIPSRGEGSFSRQEAPPLGEGLGVRLLDLSGRRITARQLRQGIFIVNGKKQVVK